MARIMLCADSRWRDTIGLALVRKGLADLGYDARVVSFQIAQQAIELFKPDILVLNHLFGRRNQQLARYVKRFGGKVIVMPTEGRPDTSAQVKWVAQQAEMTDLYDLYLSWNTQVAEIIPKSVVTGCPRFDVYRPEFQHLIESKDIVCAKYGLDGNKKVVGITTAFPSAKFAYTNRQFHKQDWKDLQIDDDPFALANGEYLQVQKFKNWIQYARLELPDYQFILKPHPMADRHLWQQFCEDNGIILTPPDYIQNFLQVCDALVARVGCSTVQDAWLMNVPVIQVDLPPLRETAFDGAAQGAAFVDGLTRKPSHLCELIASSPDYFSDEYYEGRETYWQRVNDYLSKYGYFTDIPASDLVVDEIDKLVSNVVADTRTNSPLTFNQEVGLNRLQMELARNTIYPSPMELHTNKHISEPVVWSKELEI